MTGSVFPVNKYITTYIDNYVKQFRRFNISKYRVNICGLADFIIKDDPNLSFLLQELQIYGFEVSISNGKDTIDEVRVEYSYEDEVGNKIFEYKIENLISTIYLSSKTEISIVGILVMQIISRIICKSKTIYKAIILDLDDTIWKGTLAEDGFLTIEQNLRSVDGAPFVAFMRFIQAMAKELGLYVAVCSRNDINVVRSTIEKLDENEFPIKGQIDCIVANNNDKSKNIKAIAQQLSILTNACVFIDDNPLVRDEVRQNLPEVFVPDWKNHDELLTLLVICCIFDRLELSLKSRNRKRLLKILQQERENSYLPQLFVKAYVDVDHNEAIRLYARSNQFKITDKSESFAGGKSLIFEIYRDNGENLGICSAVTYADSEHDLHVLEWAISCRYFEIGLEEYILLYLYALAGRRSITFSYNDTGFNVKTVELIEKYKHIFINRDNRIYFQPDIQSIREMQTNTNLKRYRNE